MPPCSCELRSQSSVLDKVPDFQSKPGVLNGSGKLQEGEIVLSHGSRRVGKSRDVKDCIFPKGPLNDAKEKPSNAVQQFNAFWRMSKQNSVLLPFCVEPRYLIVQRMIKWSQSRAKGLKMFIPNLRSRLVFSH